MKVLVIKTTSRWRADAREPSDHLKDARWMGQVKKKGVGYYETEGMCDFSNQSGRFQVVPEYGITNYKWVINRRLQRCNVKDQKTYHYK